MKRWIFGMALAVIVTFSSMAALAWWQPRYLFMATAYFAPEFAAQWFVNWRKRMESRFTENSLRNLESEVVRIELEGRQYNVPMRYLYGKAIEKYGRWPTAKPGRVNVKALGISVITMDLIPYYPKDDARWNVLGHGERIEIAIASSSNNPDWFTKYRDNYFSGNYKFSKRQGTVHGLVKFEGNGELSDDYFPIDDTIELSMHCNKGEKRKDYSPGCNVSSNYHPGITLNYSYGKNYLPNWKEIDFKLKELFDQFEASAKSEKNKKEN